jgi:hypothetical protein
LRLGSLPRLCGLPWFWPAYPISNSGSRFGSLSTRQNRLILAIPPWRGRLGKKTDTLRKTSCPPPAARRGGHACTFAWPHWPCGQSGSLVLSNSFITYTNSGTVLPPYLGKQYEVGAKATVGTDLLLTVALFDIDKANVEGDRVGKDFALPLSLFNLAAGRLAPRLSIKNLRFRAGEEGLFSLPLRDVQGHETDFALLIGDQQQR